MITAKIFVSRKVNLAVYSQMFYRWWLCRNVIENGAVNFDAWDVNVLSKDLGQVSDVHRSD